MIRPEDFELNWNEVYNPYSNTHKVTFSTGSEVKQLCQDESPYYAIIKTINADNSITIDDCDEVKEEKL